MSLRERDRDRREEQPAVDHPPVAGSDEARERARRLLEQGDAAIRRALSGDSRSYLSQHRQQPGE